MSMHNAQHNTENAHQRYDVTVDRSPTRGVAFSQPSASCIKTRYSLVTCQLMATDAVHLYNMTAICLRFNCQQTEVQVSFLP